ncbi:flippase [Halorussus limi]|uniref:Flippase n=1 Tax=Halorussus limi TaxID=2938695 RepID=A0A8U0HW00_9EURY|nr:flippase [Halorussus limi]UPV75250.1 flippase [Halorussus limi]
MSDADSDLADALQDAFRGAVIVLLGTIIGRGSGLLAEVWVVRTFSESGYGLLKLGVLITSLVAAVGTLGFRTGLPRQLGYEQGGQNTATIRETIGAGVLVSSGVTAILAVVMFAYGSRFVSLFGDSELVTYISLFAFALPAMVFVDVFVAVFRGLNNSKPKLYFRTLVPKFGFLAAVAVAGFFNFGFESVILAWVGGYVIAALVFIVYIALNIEYRPTFPEPVVARRLVVFSFPLLAVFFANHLMRWVDTFIIWIYTDTATVGLYSATVLLTRTIPMILGSVTFLYLPIASRFYSDGDIERVQSLYVILTKWVVGASLPLFLTFMFFPKSVLTVVFGPDLAAGASVMQLLALGFFSHTLLGTNGHTLIMLGQRRKLLAARSLMVLVNLILSVLLVPSLGIVGAALGSMAAFLLGNVAVSAYLYREKGLHPFCRDYLRPVVGTLVVAGMVGVVVRQSVAISPIVVAGYATFVGVLHVGLYLLARSVRQAEAAMIEAVMNHVGVQNNTVADILDRASFDR